ncbi:hypothetical protein H6F88_23755 [Oculatella sp. FACHB-28]|uniref:hypothetical protein n=1 Tax=Oculatella sp. FACHB-28 TaxID=2692845 RepID=UPI0016872631|nr:hypothetical protein [Oculatella sp. FACHB-28]MBD2058976.1 hypothetical protein [Oculatella sp. FACHB-28]
MTRGLLWLPLLAVFIGLAWAGWNEYQKLEAYRVWAEQFERAKYDIYSVLGQNGSTLTWGKPTRKAPVNLQTFSLEQIRAVRLWVDNQSFDVETPPQKSRKVALEFERSDNAEPIRIPFTDLSLATQWGNHLQQNLRQLQAEPIDGN